MPKESEEFVDVLEHLDENGANLVRLSEQMGMSPSGLSSAKARGIILGDIRRLASIIRTKSKLFKRYSPERYSIDYVCREGLVKQAYIARRIGVTKQALNQARGGIPEKRREKITKEIRSLGDTYETLASRLEKIAG